MRSYYVKTNKKLSIIQRVLPMVYNTTSHNDILVIKEQFYLPSVLIEVSNLLGCQDHRISQEQELTVLLFVIISDETQILGVVLSTLINLQLNLCISEYVLGHPPYPHYALVLQVGIGSDNKE